MEVGDTAADDRREHQRHAELIAQGLGQARPQPIQASRFGIGQVCQVRGMPIRLDEQGAERREAVIAGRRVVDPESIAAANQLALERTLISMLCADQTVL
jgi:hypothetical protein